MVSSCSRSVALYLDRVQMAIMSGLLAGGAMTWCMSWLSEEIVKSEALSLGPEVFLGTVVDDVPSL